MRQTFVRRILAALVVVVGLGVASSTVPAAAATGAPAGVAHRQIAPNDWQWD